LRDFNELSKSARVAIIKLDHLYYKNNSIYQKIRDCPQSTDDNKPYILEDSQRVLNELTTLINQSGTLKMKMRATLYMIYYHSIHNRFTEAKDLLLKSHIADIIYL
jgi:translation initiation factor 3 subunit C